MTARYKKENILCLLNTTNWFSIKVLLLLYPIGLTVEESVEKKLFSNFPSSKLTIFKNWDGEGSGKATQKWNLLLANITTERIKSMI